MVQPDFIAMVDEKYSLPLFTSIKQSLKFYPATTYYVYDCGLSRATADKLAAISPQVKIVPWELKYLPVNVAYDAKFLRMKTLGMLRDVVKSFFSSKVVDKSLRSFIAHQDFEVKIQNKLAIIKHHNDTVGRPFVFIDADAFLIDRFDELLDGSYDIAFTVRPKEKHRYGHNQCSLLFAGIFWFLGPRSTLKTFIDAWYQEARTIDEVNSEQTSLARWLHRLKPDIYDSVDASHTVAVNGTDIRVRVLDAEIYNNLDIYDIEGLVNEGKVKVLHFKNSRFETPQFKKVAERLGIETA